MSFNYRDIYSQLSVTNQPQANINLGSLDFKKSSPTDEKSFVASLENSHHHHCELEHGQNSFSNLKHHTSSHTNRLKRFLLSAIFSLVALCSLLALSCVELHGLPPWEVEGADLMGRALDVETRNSTLVTQKINNSMANSQLIPIIHDLLIYNLIIYAISIAYLSLIIIGMISLVLLIIILLTACIYPGQLSVEDNYSIDSCSFLNKVAFLNPWCCPCFVWDFLCCCQGLGMALHFFMTYFDGTNYNFFFLLE